MNPISRSNNLCLACGLCCNGVIFRDVELQDDDDRSQLAAAGFVARTARATATFPQPCAALCAGNRCSIYAIRPARCREFECSLLNSTASGEIPFTSALKIVRLAHRRVARVQRCLEAAGNTDTASPLRQRFKSLQRRFQRGTLDRPAVGAFAELSMAFHSLNLLLATEFYPDAK